MFSHILSVQQQEPPQTASDTFALIQSEAIRHVFLFFPFAFVEIFRVSALLTSNHQDFIQEFFLTDSVLTATLLFPSSTAGMKQCFSVQ